MSVFGCACPNSSLCLAHLYHSPKSHYGATNPQESVRYIPQYVHNSDLCFAQSVLSINEQNSGYSTHPIFQLPPTMSYTPPTVYRLAYDLGRPFPSESEISTLGFYDAILKYAEPIATRAFKYHEGKTKDTRWLTLAKIMEKCARVPIGGPFDLPYVGSFQADPRDVLERLFQEDPSYTDNEYDADYVLLAAMFGEGGSEYMPFNNTESETSPSTSQYSRPPTPPPIESKATKRRNNKRKRTETAEPEIMIESPTVAPNGEDDPPVAKRGRGRPKGSKNKPQPTTTDRLEDDEADPEQNDVEEELEIARGVDATSRITRAERRRRVERVM